MLSALEYLNQFYQEHFIFCIIITTVVCLLIGSFLNMLIYRMPLMMFNQWHQDCYDYIKNNSNISLDRLDAFYNDIQPNNTKTTISLFKPCRSICPHCNTQLLARDNIPILSFIGLKAKCRSCKAKISWRYPFVEFLSALLGILILLKYGLTPAGLCSIILCFILILIAAIDYDYLMIPDHLTYIGLWLGLLLNLSPYSITPITAAVLGAVLGYMILWSIFWLFKIITGKEGFGHGDFKLLALFGAWLGAFNLLQIITISSVIALIFSMLAGIAKKMDLDKPFPFGPYLVIAGIFTLLFPNLWPFDILTQIS